MQYTGEYLSDTTLLNFYPDVSFLDKKRLFLTQDYRMVLDQFILCPESRYPEKLKTDLKRKFLQPEIELSLGHDGFFYHYITFPEIAMVAFDRNYCKAIVYFRTSFNTGGYAKYEKINSVWRRKEYTRESWIQ
jgi:hypothetical protein